jgi:UDP-N-acetylglucosamine 2-epimerase (non-hydrolysing)
VPPGLIARTGNTVVDALQTLVDAPFSFDGTPLDGLDLDQRRLVLVTSHRRESWGRDLEEICLAIRDIAHAFPDVAIVYPVHLNPNVQSTVHRILWNSSNVHLTEPLDYLTFIKLAKRSFFILTDSGGVQEEAPTLGKPVLLLRKVTERPEAFEAGGARVVGTARREIVEWASRLLCDPQTYLAMAMSQNPYGDGKAAERIALAIRRWREGRLPLLSTAEEFQSSSHGMPVTSGGDLSPAAA